MKKAGFFFLCFSYLLTQAQVQFEQLYAKGNPLEIKTNFFGISSGHHAHADVDGDGDEDVLLIGSSERSPWEAELYLNDGSGNFTIKQNQPFYGAYFVFADFADVDGDGDQDVLISGNDTSSLPKPKLYINDGTGNFTLKLNTPFTTHSEYFEFVDVDQDLDLDLFIKGGGGGLSNSLFFNDGIGNFVLDTVNLFTNMTNGEFKFGDIDGDGDQDFITKSTSQNPRQSIIFLNNGSGVFSISTNQPSIDIDGRDFELFDIDSDGDLDAIIQAESKTFNVEIIRVFFNNGQGRLIPASDSIILTSSAEIKLFDANNDNHMDLISYGRFGKVNLYLNNGFGLFSPSPQSPINEWGARQLSISDINGDGNEDFMISGRDSIGMRSTYVYINDGLGTFKPVMESSVDCFFNHNIEITDWNNDGSEDIIFSGEKFNLLSTLSDVTVLYANDGSGNFNINRNTNVDGTILGSIASLDADNDGDKDLIISGQTAPFTRKSDLYINNGSGIFSTRTNLPFNSRGITSFAVTDFDNDNDDDLLTVGGGSATELYINNGSGTFSKLNQSSLRTTSLGDAKFGDIDGDSDLDLILGGNQKVELYFRNGNSYSLAPATFNTNDKGDFILFDIDNDNDLDLLVSGKQPSFPVITNLYRNNGSGVFSLVSNSGLDSLHNSSYDFSDVDNDGDLDLMACGQNSADQPMTKLYLNNGNGTFNALQNSIFENVTKGKVRFFDIDGDLDEDIYIAGENYYGDVITRIYKNLCSTIRTDVISACDSYTWIDGVTYTSSVDTISLTFPKPNGCDSIIKLKLTISSTYNDTLNIQTCHPYTWSANNVTYYQSGFYTDTLISVGGCDSIESLNITIDTLNTSVLQMGDSLVSLEANAQYQWLRCYGSLIVPLSGATNQSFTPLVSGQYAVKLTNAFNCTDTSICTQYIVTSTNENSANSLFKVYPNPSNDRLIIQKGDYDPNVPMQLFNIDGKLILEEFLTNEKLVLSVSKLKEGLYFVKYQNAVRRVIIAH